jgi:hypothetical protein
VLDQFETRRFVCVKERFFARLRMTAAASVILNVVKDLWVNHPLSTNCIP